MEGEIRSAGASGVDLPGKHSVVQFPTAAETISVLCWCLRARCSLERPALG